MSPAFTYAMLANEKDELILIPVLEPDGSDWVIWKNGLNFAMTAKET